MQISSSWLPLIDGEGDQRYRGGSNTRLNSKRRLRWNRYGRGFNPELTEPSDSATVNKARDSNMTPTEIILDTLSELVELRDGTEEEGKLNGISDVVAAFCLESKMSVPEARWAIRQRQAKARIARRHLARLEAKAPTDTSPMRHAHRRPTFVRSRRGFGTEPRSGLLE